MRSLYEERATRLVYKTQKNGVGEMVLRIEAPVQCSIPYGLLRSARNKF